MQHSSPRVASTVVLALVASLRASPHRAHAQPDCSPGVTVSGVQFSERPGDSACGLMQTEWSQTCCTYWVFSPFPHPSIGTLAGYGEVFLCQGEGSFVRANRRSLPTCDPVNSIDYFFIPPCVGSEARHRALVRVDGSPASPGFRVRPRNAVAAASLSDTVELFRYALPGEMYRWRRAGDNFVVVDGVQPSGSVAFGATSNTLTLSGLSVADEGLYVLQASTDAGQTYRNVDAVRVYVDRQIATITQLPEDRTACLGGATSLEVVIASRADATMRYRWHRNGRVLDDGVIPGVGRFSGTQTPTLTISDIEPGAATTYVCHVFNGSSVNSTFETRVTVSDIAAAPVMTRQPVSISSAIGAQAFFIAEVMVPPGQGPAFQWRKNGVALRDDDRLLGTRTEQLLFRSAQSEDAGTYDCVISLGCGMTLTESATLTVLAASACDDTDFNNDGAAGEDEDIRAFLSVYAGAQCPACHDIDFNNNGIFPEDQDLIDFMRVLAGSTCS